MAGIYIHIPYCKTRCIYCDFFTQTGVKEKSQYLFALCKELNIRKDYFDGELVETVYFGGGTPSQLSLSDFKVVFDTIYNNYEISPQAEITIEANPDDLNDAYVKGVLFHLPINRISIGIQSFIDDELVFLSRRHKAQKAIDAVKRCQDNGFDNISIDLMYGLPNQTIDMWEYNLNKASLLDVQHISAYHLIYEEGTKLYRMFEAGSINAVEEDTSLEMFSMLIDRLDAGGFMHYEISNFAKEGYFSRHNSSYWLGQKYLGIGSAAHSFDGKNRSFNVASIDQYIHEIGQGRVPSEIEILNLKTAYNDFILTRMRTMWGVNLKILEKNFGDDMLKYCLNNVQKHLEGGFVSKEDNILKLSRKGIFISDSIMSDLMYI